MLKIEKTEVYGWEAAFRGMRNPKNSWERSDSKNCHTDLCRDCITCIHKDTGYDACQIHFDIGPNDLKLAMQLRNAGPEHAKFLRMIAVTCDITGPLYWWKEFDTYKVGTVANSCSTMHKIADKEFTLDDFSYEHLISIDDPSKAEDAVNSGEYPFVDVTPYKDGGIIYSPLGVLNITIAMLNECRMKYITALKTDDECGISAKELWWQMIQLLPSSYNQKRTVFLNYWVLANIYHQRQYHKQDEWRVTFCDWIKSLPYSNLIIGEEK